MVQAKSLPASASVARPPLKPVPSGDTPLRVPDVNAGKAFTAPVCAAPAACIWNTVVAAVGVAATAGQVTRDPAEAPWYDNGCADTAGAVVTGLFESCSPAPAGQSCTQAGNPHTDRIDATRSYVCTINPEAADPPAPSATDRDSCQANSFDGATHVLMADGSTKPIRDVDVGDQVLATDPETGRTEAREVTHLIVGEGLKSMVAVTVDTPGPDGVLLATSGHPFWDATDRQWVDAGELTDQDRLYTPDGQLLPVADVRSFDRVQTVYNLTVDGIHTYHVLAGETPVLVHNCGGDLVAAVGGEYSRITTPGSAGYLSISKRGPVLTGVQDRLTGEIVMSLNRGTSISNLHPSLSARLPDSGFGSLYPGGSGVHGEVHGLNELLWRREAAGMSTVIDDSFGFYSVRLRGAQQGSQIAACAVCVGLTS
jgi:hypothetical protein